MNKSTITEKAQYLTFALGEEVFAIEVTQVREVLDYCQITRVPKAPDFMRGVINVRGSVVPVIDLRLKFGLQRSEPTVNTRIIVIEIMLEGDKTVLGAIADAVHEVMEIQPDQIEGTPSIGTRWKSDFIKGIGKHGNQFIIILDIDKIFTTDELLILESDQE